MAKNATEMKEKTHSTRRKSAERIEKTVWSEKMSMATMHKRGKRDHMKRRKKIRKKKNSRRRLKQSKKNNCRNKRNSKKRKNRSKNEKGWTRLKQNKTCPEIINSANVPQWVLAANEVLIANFTSLHPEA